MLVALLAVVEEGTFLYSFVALPNATKPNPCRAIHTAVIPDSLRPLKLHENNATCIPHSIGSSRLPLSCGREVTGEEKIRFES